MLMKTLSTMNPTDAAEGTPVSVKIRERLLAARKKFHANDNIAELCRGNSKNCSMKSQSKCRVCWTAW